MLVDDVTIEVKAGDGGNGRVSLIRNAQTTRGGPDGGNGGNGGSLYAQGINDILALQEFRFKKKLAAESGINGGRKNLYGRNGKDLTIYVPLGTIITDTKNGHIWDISDDTTKVLICQGGKGGRGNNEFKSATNQTPRFAENGTPGQLRELRLELKLIADIGLIGLPNAGKSSLLAVLTNAHPKIGNYPFTTLEPNIGVYKHLVLADIPGLIEGASEGKGLGITFLRHVEKTKLLFHLVSAENENVYNAYQTVRRELQKYSPKLAEKTEVVLLTKVDLCSQEEITKKLKELQKTWTRGPSPSGRKKEIIPLSIYDDSSLEKVKEALL